MAAPAGQPRAVGAFAAPRVADPSMRPDIVMGNTQAMQSEALRKQREYAKEREENLARFDRDKARQRAFEKVRENFLRDRQKEIDDATLDGDAISAKRARAALEASAEKARIENFVVPQAVSSMAVHLGVVKAPATEHAEGPANYVMMEVIRYLDQNRGSVALDTVFRAVAPNLGVADPTSLARRADVMTAVANNPKIVFNEFERTVRYCPTHPATNIDEVEKEVKKAPFGIPSAELRDCYQGVDADIDSLVASRRLLRVGKKGLLFWVNREHVGTVSPDLQGLWRAITLKVTDDVAAALKKEGLATVATTSNRPKGGGIKPKAKRRRRRTSLKFKNTHLPEAQLKAIRNRQVDAHQ